MPPKARRGGLMLANRTAERASEPTRIRRLPALRRVPALGGLAGAALPYVASIVLVIVLGTALWKSGIAQPNIFSTVPFILAVQIAAFAWGRGPAIAAAFASALTFNYYWIGPPYEFEPPTPEEWFLFAALLGIALGLGTVADRMRLVRQQARDLTAGEQLQRALLNSISHDLRTPLTAIMGSLTTLLAEKGPVGRIDARERQELLSIAYDRAKILDGLVAQILDMTKLDAGGMRVQAEPGSLRNLMQLALRSMGDPIEARCRVSIPADTPLVPMDAVLLAQAVRNVVDNAERYSPPETTIEIDAARTPREVVLSVADRGPGIPEADLERVFEKFHQVSGASDDRRGVGLGLAIAKGIVEAHGGRIWAEQRVGGGTVVRLALPLT
ncbi:MAG TPA: ATP-binding protein [bacterium]|nr:ATP-binding protein [bacterium]